MADVAAGIHQLSSHLLPSEKGVSNALPGQEIATSMSEVNLETPDAITAMPPIIAAGERLDSMKATTDFKAFWNEGFLPVSFVG